MNLAIVRSAWPLFVHGMRGMRGKAIETTSILFNSFTLAAHPIRRLRIKTPCVALHVVIANNPSKSPGIDKIHLKYPTYYSVLLHIFHLTRIHSCLSTGCTSGSIECACAGHLSSMSMYLWRVMSPQASVSTGVLYSNLEVR